MIIHQLTICASNQPTLLERLLQVTRYRGYQVMQLQVERGQQSDELKINLTVGKPAHLAADSVNGIQHLYHQLGKLFDVKHVNLEATK